VVDDDDWRLQGQEEYLVGRRLRWAKWVGRPDWDHDHCEFCWAEFSAEVTEHSPHNAGWVTADDNDHWVCPGCFEDFRERFQWTVESGPPSE
jgi:hypothetical protein